MTDIQVAWIAGLIEGEGYIALQRNPNRPNPAVRVRVDMTDEDVVRRLQEWSGVGTVNGPYWNHARNQTKAVWVWNLQKQGDVIPFLKLIHPMMGQRRGSKIEEVLNAIGESVRDDYIYAMPSQMEVGVC